MSVLKFIINLVLWVIGSVILIHVAGFLGIFVAAAYWLWWLIVPQKTPCLFCRWKRVGEICPACGCRVEAHTCYPKRLKSVVINSAAILVVSLISFSVVYLETRVLSYYGVSPLDKTVSFVIPTQGQYRLGEIFPMKVDLTGVETNVNTVRADLSFDPNYLEVSDIQTSGSFASVFVQKEIDNESGFARISGGVPNPGEKCLTNCHFASFLFKTKKPGTVVVKYLPTSLVLANDGQGTSILKDLGSVSFLILPEKVSSEENKSQEGALKLSVLGAETQNAEGQLLLYRGNPILETSVLGSNTDSNSATQTPKSQWLEKALSILQKFDLFTLNVWKTIFGLRK